MLVRSKRMTVIMRLLHWALASSVVACFVTGLYIAEPFWWRPTGYGPSVGMMMGNIRFVHFVFAMILDVAFLLWLYFFFFSTSVPFVSSLFPLGLRLREAGQMLRHYFTLSEQPRHHGRLDIDPLNAYGFLLIHLLILVQMITGFALMAPTFSHANSFLQIWPWMLGVSESICLGIFGTVVVVRQVHHVAAFAILALAIMHIYIQIWRDTYWHEGHMSVVFSGYKYIEKD